MKPNTIAKSIAIGNPADGFHVLEALRETGGWGEMVTDDEIVDGIQLLAETEGIFTEPAGGTTVAVTKKLIEQGRIPRDESIVICITGNGYKTLEVLERRTVRPTHLGRSLRSSKMVRVAARTPVQADEGRLVSSGPAEAYAASRVRLEIVVSGVAERTQRTNPPLLRRRRRRRPRHRVRAARPDAPRLSALDLDFDLAGAPGRVRVRRVVAEHVVVARLGVDPLQRLVEVVLVHHRDAAGLLGDHAQAVLRLRARSCSTRPGRSFSSRSGPPTRPRGSMV